MKKIIAILLSLATAATLAAGVCACGNGDGSDNGSNNNTEQGGGQTQQKRYTVTEQEWATAAEAGSYKNCKLTISNGYVYTFGTDKMLEHNANGNEDLICFEDGKTSAWYEKRNDSWRALPAGSYSVEIDYDYRLADALFYTAYWHILALKDNFNEFTFDQSTNSYVYGGPMQLNITLPNVDNISVNFEMNYDSLALKFEDGKLVECKTKFVNNYTVPGYGVSGVIHTANVLETTTFTYGEQVITLPTLSGGNTEQGGASQGGNEDIVLNEDTDFDALVSDRVNDVKEWYAALNLLEMNNSVTTKIRAEYTEGPDVIYNIKKTRNSIHIDVEGYPKTYFSKNADGSYSYIYYYLDEMPEGEEPLYIDTEVAIGDEHYDEVASMYDIDQSMYYVNFAEFFHRFTYDEKLNAYVFRNEENPIVAIDGLQYSERTFTNVMIKIVGGKIAYIKIVDHVKVDEITEIPLVTEYFFYDYNTTEIARPEPPKQ